MKTDFFPTPPEALKSAAKICIGSTGFAFFQLPAPAGDRWGSVLSRPSFRGGGGKDGTQKQPNKNPTSNKAAGGAKCHRPGSTEPWGCPFSPAPAWPDPVGAGPGGPAVPGAPPPPGLGSVRQVGKEARSLPGACGLGLPYKNKHSSRRRQMEVQMGVFSHFFSPTRLC